MTFMQQYREFKKLNTQVRPVLDERIIRVYGHKLAGLTVSYLFHFCNISFIALQ